MSKHGKNNQEKEKECVRPLLEGLYPIEGEYFMVFDESYMGKIEKFVVVLVVLASSERQGCECNLQLNLVVAKKQFIYLLALWPCFVTIYEVLRGAALFPLLVLTSLAHRTCPQNQPTQIHRRLWAFQHCPP